MKKITVIFLFFLVILFSVPAFAQENLRIAVLPFKNISSEHKYDWLSYGFSESLTTAFAQVGKFIVVERAQIDQVLKEQAFQQSGFVDDKGIAQLGEVLGVDKLLIGSYQIMGDNININSRVIDVKTAEIDKKSIVSNKRGKINSIFELQEEISLIHANGIQKISAEEKGKFSPVLTKSTSSITAYELYSKGRGQFLLFNPQGYRNAINYYNQALEIDSSYSLALGGLAQAYAKLGSNRYYNGQDPSSYFKKALEYGNKAVTLAPELAESHKGLAVAWYKQGEKEKAEQSFLKALAINSLDADVYYLMWKSNGEGPDSPNIKRALELNPSFGPAYNDLGNIYMQRKDYEMARQQFEKAIQVNPYFGFSYLSLGNIYQETKDFQKAIAYYQKALETDPDFSYACISLGNAYRALNDLSSAVRYYEKAIEINPEFVLAYNNLGAIYHLSRDYDKAIARYQKAITLNPKFEDPYYNLGLAYERKGNNDKAIETYNRFISLFPASPNIAVIKESVQQLRK